MDCDSTVDGDMHFGFGLTLGNAQWGNAGVVKYGDEASKTIPHIKMFDFTAAKLPLLGDWGSLPGEPVMWKTTTKPPNYMLGHLRAFGKHSNDMFWMEAIEAIQNSINTTVTKYSPMTGLMPVILVMGTTPPAPTAKVISDTDAGSYAGEAGAFPLLLAMDLIAGGDMRTRTELAKITGWIKTSTGGDPSKIVDGYRLNGDPIGTKGTMAYVAPFATVSIFDAANQAWLDAAWKLMKEAPAAGQYADTANVLGMLLVSGNWWQP